MPTNRIIDVKRVENNPTEPLTLTEAKAHLIITSTDDDTLITALITQCRRAIEEYCAISIVPKTITLIADLFKEWELPYGPVTGIQGVATRTGNEGSGPGTYETLTSGWGQDADNFIPAPAGGFNPGIPFTGYFQWGPDASHWGNCGNRYKIIYTAGYSANNVLPVDLKLAILNELSYRYENRGENPLLTGICEPARIIAHPHKRLLWF